MSRLGNGWLLATGTLTVVRVPAPGRVDRGVAAAAMTLAPVAVLPLGIAAALVTLVGHGAGFPSLVTAYLVVATLALGTRALHWDGLADTVDGLTASYSAARSLEVMRSGTSGPAGVLAIVLVASLQAAALTPLVGIERGWLAVGLLACASRAALPLACVRGVPAARTEGLGAVHVGSVPLPVVTGVLAAAAAATVAAVTLAGGSVWGGLAGWAAMVAATLVLVLRCVRRLGGVTGDVLGACVEVSLAVLLVATAASQ